MFVKVLNGLLKTNKSLNLMEETIQEKLQQE